MANSNDWTTPHTFESNALTPFLGKPPLAFWATALSLKTLGMSAFSARLPSLIAFLILSYVAVIFARRFFNDESAVLMCICMFASLVGFFFAGACMTDSWLSLSVGLSVVSSVFCIRGTEKQKKYWWGLTTFLGLALGLLCKGPVAVILTVLASLPFVLHEGVRHSLRSFPWITGLALTTVLTVPWYLAEDFENPGFLRYFLINENILRFLIKEYGDKYGSGHQHVYGTIWLYLIVALLPWPLILLSSWTRKVRSRDRDGYSYDRGILLALLGWGLSPALFFTISRQISVYYVLPGVPALSLLFVLWVQNQKERKNRFFRLSTSLFSSLFFGLSVGLSLTMGVYLSELGTSLLCTILSCFIALLASRIFLRSNASEVLRVAVVALSATTLYTVVNLAPSALLGPISPVNGLIGVLESDPILSEVTFYDQVPHSAYFYARDGINDHLILKETEDFSDNWKGPLVMKMKKWKKLGKKYQQQVRVVREVDGWLLLNRIS